MPGKRRNGLTPVTIEITDDNGTHAITVEPYTARQIADALQYAGTLGSQHGPHSVAVSMKAETFG